MIAFHSHPDQGSHPQPKRVPRLGIKPANFRRTGQLSNQLRPPPARALTLCSVFTDCCLWSIFQIDVFISGRELPFDFHLIFLSLSCNDLIHPSVQVTALFPAAFSTFPLCTLHAPHTTGPDHQTQHLASPLFSFLFSFTGVKTSKPSLIPPPLPHTQSVIWARRVTPVPALRLA